MLRTFVTNKKIFIISVLAVIAYNLRYRSSAAKFAFLITDATYKLDNNFGIGSMNEIADMLNSKDILTSVVTNSYNYSAYSSLTDITGGSLIPMSGNFCDDMYEVIFSQTPKSSIVIANNLVTGYFKEPLVYGGLCNSDGDSLTDSDEIDWKNVKLNSDGSYSLYTWKELCEKSGIWHSVYDDGKSNPMFEYLSDIYVIPALSNPFSADTDNDYYPDGYDDDNLIVNAMYIYDSAIDDSDFHNGSLIERKTPDKYTDGILSLFSNMDTSEYTARYSFSRRSGEYSSFSLTPDETSFYKFTNEASMSAYVFVSYEKKTLWWSETISVEQEEDGTYLLNGGTEYTVETYGVQSGGYNFTVEQDNWVYAPNGGMWTVTEHSFSSAISGNLMSGQLYMPSYKVLEAISLLRNDSVIMESFSGNDIESQIKFLLDNNGMSVSGEELKSALISIGGAVGQVIAFIVAPGGKAKAGCFLISVLANGMSNASTFIGAYSGIETVFDYFEQYGFKRACLEGDLSVVSTHYVSAVLGNVWDGWTTAPYINKISISSGDIGKVVEIEEVEMPQFIIDWCGWSID